jgi:quercetin 2,3-dioxygenase
MQLQAKIFLAEDRGLNQLDWFRSYHTFSFGIYQNENKKPFGTLQVCNEDTLAAGRGMKMTVEENTEVIILPLVGTLLFKNILGDETYVSPGQVQLFSATAGMDYELMNPFKKEELVNFLQLWLYKNDGVFKPLSQQFNFNLDKTNRLISIIDPAQLHQPSFCFIGKYDGRKKDEYALQNKKNGIYVFVIEGAFEIQDRLLQAKDGLAIWNTNEIDFEALSNNAILLLLEIPL